MTRDPLGAARGIILGVLLAMPLWALIWCCL
jgi:hypothetical protein